MGKFDTGTYVRARGRSGPPVGVITNHIPKLDWKIPGYHGEGYYYVRQIGDGPFPIISVDAMVDPRTKSIAAYIVDQHDMEVWTPEEPEQEEADMPMHRPKNMDEEYLMTWEYDAVEKGTCPTTKETCAKENIRELIAALIMQEVRLDSIRVWRRTNFRVVERTPWELKED